MLDVLIVVGIIIVGIPLLVGLYGFLEGTSKHQKVVRLAKSLNERADRIRPFLESNFMVQPCSRCHEFQMLLLDISPNARSIHYECTSCGKKMRAPAGAPEAHEVIEDWERYSVTLSTLRPKLKELRPELEKDFEGTGIDFETPPAPLPYEQTQRSPIPQAVRTEVWRRDSGSCVQCGSKENLHFDHIIPVSKGGATTAQNLQLLCQSCNLKKGANI